MKVDYHQFIVKGEFGYFKFASPKRDVIKLLGDPPLYAPFDRSYNGSIERAKYGDLEFAFRDDGTISHFSLRVQYPNIEIPKQLTMINFETPALTKEFVLDLLEIHNVTNKRLEAMCCEEIDYRITSRGVHLSFGGDNRLGILAACNPDEKWGT